VICHPLAEADLQLETENLLASNQREPGGSRSKDLGSLPGPVFSLHENGKSAAMFCDSCCGQERP